MRASRETGRDHHGRPHRREVHWVGNQLPPEVYDPGPMEASPEDDTEIYWTRESDGWHGYAMDWSGEWYETDGHGAFWACDDGYMDDLSPEENKELEEAYSVYENKAKTFLQRRQFQRAKGKSRGFYPPSLFKGKKGKGKSKSKKGKGRPPMTSSPPSSSIPSTFMANETVLAADSSSTGCFISGDKSHGFRNCPKRSASSSPTTGKGFHWTSVLLSQWDPSKPWRC